jgi:2-polyprenyl-3-methyl-5-hydroxy-6-metoxy-1,4-benzoquinol methylase
MGSRDDTSPRADIDEDALVQFQLRLFGNLQGAVTSALVHLGDRLGLYRALAESGEPLTTAELAARTGLSERWVREWAFQQGAAALIAVDPETERLALTPEANAVLADPTHEAFGMGEFDHLCGYFASLPALEQSFRTGLGHDFDHHGMDGAVALERSFEPWNRHHLVADVLPALDGAVDALTQGIDVADIGCGAGGAVLMLAEAFPNSRITGYDISRHALDRATERLAEAGASNARFVDPRREPLPSDESLQLVTMFDCLHDMTDPQAMAGAVRASLDRDGWWLLCDIKGRDTYAENAERNPMAALMYGFSVLSCMSSGLSEPGGAGLGTLGMSESKARDIAATAGFTRFRRLPVDHPTNAFYEIRR